VWSWRKILGAETVNGCVPIIVGTLLIGAGFLKADRAFTDVSDRYTFLFRLGLIELEIVLGLVLVFAVWPRVSRLAALVVFAGFAAAAFVQAVAGVRSCACLGRVEASPWIMGVLDLCVLAILWLWKPLPAPDVIRTKRFNVFLGCCAFPVLLPVLILSENLQLRSQVELVVSEHKGDLDNVMQGEEAEFKLYLKNPHEHEITVYELDSTCPCLRAKDLPWSFGPGRGRFVELRFDSRDEPNFSGKLRLEFSGKTADKRDAFRATVNVRVLEWEKIAVLPEKG
jgi:hypothetical protein